MKASGRGEQSDSEREKLNIQNERRKSSYGGVKFQRERISSKSRGEKVCNGLGN